jgi:hypothetical protein
MTKKINNVNWPRQSAIQFPVIHQNEQHTPVHINFWLKGTLVSGAATSGRRGVKGLIRSRNRTISQTPVNMGQLARKRELSQREMRSRAEATHVRSWWLSTSRVTKTIMGRRKEK